MTLHSTEDTANPPIGAQAHLPFKGAAKILHPGYSIYVQQASKLKWGKNVQTSGKGNLQYGSNEPNLAWRASFQQAAKSLKWGENFQTSGKGNLQYGSNKPNLA